MKNFFESGFGRQLYASRYRVMLTYVLAFCASALVFLYPLLTGYAIDGALAGNMAPILTLIVIWAGHLLVDYFRMRYDTITFADIEARAIVDLVKTQRAGGQDTSTITARSTMIRELSDFFAYHVPGILTYVLAPFGALVTLWIFDSWVGAAALLYTIVTLSFIGFIFPRSRELNRAWNDQQENSVSVINNADEEATTQHYKGLAQASIRISNLAAGVDALTETTRILLTLAFLWRLSQIGTVTAGEAYAAISYLWRLADGVNYVPNVSQQIARLTDILRRIRSGEEIA